MIQRIQSVYLLLTAIFYTIILFVPIAYLGNEYVFNAWSFSTIKGIKLDNTFYLALMAIAIAIISLVAIFMYKNRQRQSKVCLSLVVLIMIFCVFIYFIYPEFMLKRIVGPNLAVNYTVWSILSVVPFLFVILANKAILKDDKKIRAADRLR